MPKVQANGIELFYEESGAGEPLLLIAGFGCDHTNWRKLVPLLASSYRLITFDNRGVGQSTSPATPYTIGQMAEDTIGLLDAIDLTSVHIAGHSMGGQIALELALACPGRVKSLILLASCVKMDERGRTVIELSASAVISSKCSRRSGREAGSTLPANAIQDLPKRRASSATPAGALPSRVCASRLPSPVMMRSASAIASAKRSNSATSSKPRWTSAPQKAIRPKPNPPAAPAPGRSLRSSLRQSATTPARRVNPASSPTFANVRRRIFNSLPASFLQLLGLDLPANPQPYLLLGRFLKLSQDAAPRSRWPVKDEREH